MSVWKIMNWVAWGLSAYLVVVMAIDFIRTERRARAAKDGGSTENGRSS